MQFYCIFSANIDYILTNYERLLQKIQKVNNLDKNPFPSTPE